MLDMLLDLRTTPSKRVGLTDPCLSLVVFCGQVLPECLHNIVYTLFAVPKTLFDYALRSFTESARSQSSIQIDLCLFERGSYQTKFLGYPLKTFGRSRLVFDCFPDLVSSFADRNDGPYRSENEACLGTGHLGSCCRCVASVVAISQREVRFLRNYALKA
jgi:hypothetical protein